MCPHYDPETTFLSSHPYINKNMYQQKCCAKMFIIALFIIEKNENNLILINKRMKN